MTIPKIAVSKPEATIRLNIFPGAFEHVPVAQDDYSWPELCDELEALTRETAAPGDPVQRKKELLAFTLGTLSEPRNVNANYLDHTALAIDVDNAPPEQLEVIEASGLAAFVYASPSDPNPDGSRRLRVVVPLSEPLKPEAVLHARLALAELLGIGPGQGVETAAAIRQIMFVGRLHGTPKRQTWRFDGEPLDVPALLATPLAQQWKKERKQSAATATVDRVGIVDPDERTAALLDALAQHWEAPGEATGRRQVLRALGGYLAKRGWPDEQIAAVARALPTHRPEAARVALMLDCARDARRNPEGAAGWSTITGWNPEAAAQIEAVAKDPREPAGFAGVWSERWAAIEARAAQKKAERSVGAPSDPMRNAGTPADAVIEVPVVLRSRNGRVTLLWENDEIGHRPIADRIVRTRIRELGHDRSLIELFVKGKPVSVDAILEAHGATYEHTAYAFSNRITAYDASGVGRVTIGYPVAGIVARYDADADAWLRALAGPHYERLAIWIASCDQRHINRLSACLILIGEKDIGKSMFGHAVALLWNQTPPPLSLLVVQFNSDLLRCPILVDEEAQLFGSKALSTKRFRDVIQSVGRSVEFKGLERCELHGALRAAVSCNGYSDLRFADLGGPAVIDALRDRLLVLDALKRTAECAAPLARLRLLDDHRVDIQRIAAHMAWLCETVELTAERFLGAGGDNSEAAILAGQIDEHIDLWETFRDWLDNGKPAGVWSVHEGKGLCVDPKALALSLENTGRGWDRRQVGAALAPFHVDDWRPREGARPRLWVLNHTRIAGALALDQAGARTLERRLSGKPESRFGAFGG